MILLNISSLTHSFANITTIKSTGLWLISTTNAICSHFHTMRLFTERQLLLIRCGAYMARNSLRLVHSILICLLPNRHLKMLIILQYRRIPVHHAVSAFRCVHQLYILSINLSHNNVYAAPTTFTPILSKTAYLSPNSSAAIDSAPNVLNTVCQE